MAEGSGKTAGSQPIVYTADYATPWEPVGRCITRNGSPETSTEGREFRRTIVGYERCGVGFLGCPQAGTVSIESSTVPGVPTVWFAAREARLAQPPRSGSR